TPLRATAAENFLKGKKGDAATLGEAAKLAAQAASPSADRRGAVAYKKEMARVLTARALAMAIARAQGAEPWRGTASRSRSTARRRRPRSSRACSSSTFFARTCA